MDVPLPGDGTVLVPPGSPIQLMVLLRLLQGFPITVQIHAQQRERPAFILLYERPLVTEHSSAWPSVGGPKIEQNYLASIIAEVKRFAVGIDAGDLRRRFGGVGRLVACRSCRVRVVGDTAH